MLIGEMADSVGVSKSSVSREFIEAGNAELASLLARRFIAFYRSALNAHRGIRGKAQEGARSAPLQLRQYPLDGGQ